MFTMSRKTKKVAPGDSRKSGQGSKRPTQAELVETCGLAEEASRQVRKPSHVPLSDGEREKLHALARSMGLSYAAWARATMLVVADWPLDCQPIRGATAVRRLVTAEDVVTVGRDS